jgi:hypothetical protein
MSHRCQYCGAELLREKDLLRHQKEAKKCLGAQRLQGLDPEQKEYPCKCGKVYAAKKTLKRHQKTCGSNLGEITNNDNRVVNNTTNNNTTNNTQNNSLVTINLNGDFGSLTPEIIAEKVFSVLTLEHVQQGLAKMAAMVAPKLFRNDEGWFVRIADKSRDKLEIIRDGNTEPEPDHGGTKTAGVLRESFVQAGLDALKEDPDSKEVD